MEYKTIAKPCEARFIEKKSEFIGYLCPVTTEEQATAFIEEVRAMHRKATHNCYAYILRENNTARHSDDGEPGGTAGVPIYEVLRKEGLTDICCVVTRYFGGIMLGAGGLVRAYTRAAKDAADAAQIKCMAEARKLVVTVDYGLYGRLAQVFLDNDARIENEEFADNVKITLHVREENARKLNDKLIDVCNGNVNVETVQKLKGTELEGMLCK
ncbi:MAG: YigZ family protein, partial [Oscillospiraceae bacterium]